MKQIKKNNITCGYVPFSLTNNNKLKKNAILILENGDYFLGHGFGANCARIGELCFNTSITGYQEIISDPSYTKQIITFTFPHIGNVGVNSNDLESKNSFVSGIVVRQKPTSSSNWRSKSGLHEWLCENKIPGISGIDTRFLTKIVRKTDTINALICNSQNKNFNFDELISSLKNHPSMKGMELLSKISTKINYSWKESTHFLIKNKKKNININKKINIVAIDFGIKLNILRNLFERKFNVTTLPHNSSFEDIMSYDPSGIFLSNGPGDPEATNPSTFKLIKKLIDLKIPIFGICIGHQLLAISLGAKTAKMKQGHRGANHPVKNLKNNKVEITSQNHGFEVEKKQLPENLKITHLSLFDKSIEGIEHKFLPIFSVQFHPEASPGPMDSSYLFDQFYNLTLKYQNAKKN